MGQFTVQAEGKVGQFGGYVGEGGMLMELGILPGYVQGAGDMIAQTRQQEEAPGDGGWHCPARERGGAPRPSQATR